MPSEISLRKTQLRAQMKNYRANLNADERARAAQFVCEKLSVWLRNRAETRIAVYLATPFELNLDALVIELLRANKIVCAPRSTPATSQMHFARLLDLNAVTCGEFGVREPIFEEIVWPEIVLVPGLAFDQNGGRLGMGGGYYDRVLNEITIKIGVCFGGQIVDFVPLEAHDVRMNFVASEAGLNAIKTSEINSQPT